MKHLSSSHFIVTCVTALFLAGCTPMKPVTSSEPPVKPVIAKEQIPVPTNHGCKGVLDYYELFSVMEKKARKLEIADIKKHYGESKNHCDLLKLGLVLSQPGTEVQNDKSAGKSLKSFISNPALITNHDHLLAKLILDEIKERGEIRKSLNASYRKKLEIVEQAVVIKEVEKTEVEKTEAVSSDSESALEVLARENSELRKKLEQLTNIEKTLGEKEQATVTKSLQD